MALQIVGMIHNFVTQPSATPEERLHDRGLTFLAVDARTYPHWSGEALRSQWIVRRDIPEHEGLFEPWPEVGWRFENEQQARAAYQTLRQHILTRVAGLQPRPEAPRQDDEPEKGLLAPALAWSEAFYHGAAPIAWLSCDRSTEARTLALITDGLSGFTVDHGPQTGCASYATQVSPCYVAVSQGPQGTLDGVFVVYSPGQEVPLIQAGLDAAENDGTGEDAEVEVPSGILIVAWGRPPGWPLFTAQPNVDPAAVVHAYLRQNLAAPLPTPIDQRCPGPIAYAFRVTPGTYDAEYRFLETARGGISCMALSRQG